MAVETASPLSMPSSRRRQVRRRPRLHFSWATFLRTLVIIAVVAIFMFPIYFWFLASFKPFGLIFTLPPVFVFEPTFNWYAVVLGGVPYNQMMLELTGGLSGQGGGFYYSVPYLFTSAVVATVATIFVILISAPAAYALSRFAFRRRHDLVFWILSTRMMPAAVVALPFFFMYRSLEQSAPFTFLGITLIDSYPGVILVHTVVNLPLAILLLKSFMDEVPSDLDDAAMVDGASRFRSFVLIARHYILPGVAATAILTFIFSWNEFLLTLVLTRTQVRTIPVAASMFETSTGGTEWGLLAALGTSAMLPVFIFILFVQKNLVRGLTMGAVKGG